MQLELDVVHDALGPEPFDYRLPSRRVDYAECDGRLPEDIVTRAIHELGERVIGVKHHPVGQSADEQGQGIGVESLTKAFLRFHQRQLRDSAAGDVAGDAQHRLDLADSVAQGDRVRGEPGALALETDHLELQRARFAGEDAAVQVRERRPILGRHDVDDGQAAHLVDALGLDHREAGGIHIEQPALLIHQLHAFGFGLDDCPQPSFAFLQRELGATPVRNVETYPSHTADAPMRLVERLDPTTERPSTEAHLVRLRLAAERSSMGLDGAHRLTGAFHFAHTETLSGPGDGSHKGEAAAVS